MRHRANRCSSDDQIIFYQTTWASGKRVIDNEWLCKKTILSLAQSTRKNESVNDHQKREEDKVSCITSGDITSIVIQCMLNYVIPAIIDVQIPSFPGISSIFDINNFYSSNCFDVSKLIFEIKFLFNFLFCLPFFHQRCR